MNPRPATGTPLHLATSANAVFLLLASRDAYERYVARYHSGGLLFELWVSLASAGALTALCVGLFQRPIRRWALVVNTCMLALALGMSAFARMAEQNDRTRDGQAQELLDQSRRANQSPAEQ